jgi:DNA-directed RNA polymerase specialized sigma24 family protein
LLAAARGAAPDLDVEDLASQALCRTFEKWQAGNVEDPGAFARKILRDSIADVIRLRERERTLRSAGGSSASDVDSARHRGGRPAADVFRSAEELQAATLAELGREFALWWNTEPGAGLALLREALAGLPEGRRRSWLARALDFELGDWCPWAVDSAFRTEGATRARPARGVGTEPRPVERDDWATRAMALIADPEVRSWLAGMPTVQERDAALWALVKRPESVEKPPLGGAEFLTDREMAIVSLLLGNWPASVTERLPASVGDVLTAEVDAIQYARRHHGALKSAADKLAGGVGPKPRRR